MCDECEQGEPLAAVYQRKANRFGWRPPVAATVPRTGDDPAPRQPAAFVCADANERVE